MVYAKDEQGVDVDKPMEIQVRVMDENDNAPVCDAAELEVQENEVVGKCRKCLHTHTQQTQKSSPEIVVTKCVCVCMCLFVFVLALDRKCSGYIVGP